MWYKILGFLILLVIALAFWGVHRDIPLEKLKVDYANVQSEFLDLDGQLAHLQLYGEGDTTLVLIHGTGASVHTWHGWVDFLKDKYQVLLVDLPGFGLTGPSKTGEYTMESYCTFVHTILQKKNISKAILGGNSLGGAVAWNYALLFPEEVQALILVDPAGVPSQATSVPLAFRIAKMPVFNTLFLHFTPKVLLRKSLENVYADPEKVSQTLVDQYFAMALREGNRKAFLDRMQLKNESRFQDLGSIQKPVLLLWGKEDRLIPPSASDYFAKLLLRDTLVVLENLGHVPMEEDPSKSIQPVLEFLKNLNGQELELQRTNF